MSARPDFKGDYMGFTYGTRIDDTGAEVPMHSSDLGIVRTSEGSRFNENLLPTIQDKTVQVPGGDGTYYFGSYYTQRPFTISFAFDSLTEEQVAKIKSHFGDKGVHNLIFDEVPYKVYKAKVTGTATIKHIPFAEGETNRVYKGEGTIQFTCYDPYARSMYKWLNEYSDDKYPNKNEWAAASGLLENQEDYDKIDNTTTSIRTYNPGVKESNFTLKIETLPNSDFSIEVLLGYGVDSSTSIGKLEFSQFTLEPGDEYIIIDSKNNLVEGYNNENEKTGTLYNQYIKDGDFFKIPLGEGTMQFTGIKFTEGLEPLSYSYYYF